MTLAQALIHYTDSIYLEFGADDARWRASAETEDVKEIRKRAIQAGLKLVDCPIRHLGTEKAQEIYHRHRALSAGDTGVEIRFGCACTDLLIQDGRCVGVRLSRGPDGV